MKRLIVLAIASLLFLLAAQSVYAASGVMAGTLGPIIFAEGEEDGQPVNPTDRFEEGVSTIYAFCGFAGLVADDTVEAIWYADDTVIYEETTSLEEIFGGIVPDEGMLWFWVDFKQGAPAGTYRLEILLNGELVRSGEFTVGEETEPVLPPLGRAGPLLISLQQQVPVTLTFSLPSDPTQTFTVPVVLNVDLRISLGSTVTATVEVGQVEEPEVEVEKPTEPTAIDASSEPNDTRDEAIAVQADIEYRANLSDTNDVDFFVVDLVPGTTFSLVMTRTENLRGIPEVRLTDAEGSYIADGQLGLDGLQIVRRLSASASGSYYIEVRRGLGDYIFQVTMAAANDANTGGDASDDFSTPTVIRPGTDYEGDLGDLDTDDYYAFSVEPGSIFTVTLSGISVSGRGRLKATIYDSTQDWVGEVEVQVSGRSATFRRTLDSQTGGTYIVSLTGVGHYGLRIDVATQDDGGSGGDAPEEIATAVAIPLGTDLTGVVGNGDAADALALAVDPGSQITITLGVPGKGKIKAILYDLDGNYVDETGDITSGKSQGITRILSADEPTDYVLLVRGEGEYSLRVDATAQNDAESGGDAGNSPDNPTPIEVNTSYTGQLGNRNTEDYYAFNVAGGTVVQVDLSLLAVEGRGQISAVLYHDGSYLEETEAIRAGKSGTLARILSGEEGGDYVLRVRGEGVYQFTVNSQSHQDGGSEGDAGAEAEAAVKIGPDADLRGVVGDDDGEDFYLLEDVPAGATVFITVTLDAEPKGTSLVLTLYDEEESYLTESDRVDTGASTTLEYTFERGGPLYLRFRGSGGYAFHITISGP
jgi:hypothetical protein